MFILQGRLGPIDGLVRQASTLPQGGTHGALRKYAVRPTQICTSDAFIGLGGRRRWVGSYSIVIGDAPFCGAHQGIRAIDHRRGAKAQRAKLSERNSRLEIHDLRSFASLHSSFEARVRSAAESSLDGRPASGRTLVTASAQAAGPKRRPAERRVRPISCPHALQGLQVEGLREQFWRAPPLPWAHAP